MDMSGNVIIWSEKDDLRKTLEQIFAVSNVLAISVRHHLTDEEYVITKRNATTIVVAAPAIEDY